VKRRLSPSPWSLPETQALSRLAGPLACALAIQGCTTVSDSFTGNKVDYRAGAVRAQPVDVPPDLTQLQADPRYQPSGGASVSAIGLDASPRNVPTASGSSASVTAQSVAVTTARDLRVVRVGNERWLVTDQTPEVLWPKLRTFWQQVGFTLAVDKPAAGVMETDWKENRTKVSTDVVRRTLGGIFDSMYDSGERDRYRLRMERGSSGTEITISHRGMVEKALDPKLPDTTRWVPRPNDPSLEAELMAQLIVALSGGSDGAPTGSSGASAKVKADAQVAAASSPPARARLLDGRAMATVQMDDDLERAWRRVGIALDRSGFTIEDRDRGQGQYQVRYVDPKLAGQEEPGLFARMFGAKRAELIGARYTVKLQADGKASTLVSVQEEKAEAAGTNSAGNARNIAELLVAELR
jgi:outer membrane protein assembly factor BamC